MLTLFIKSSFGVSLGCSPNLHVNNLQKATNQVVSGWTLMVENGQWEDPQVTGHQWIHDLCTGNGDGWFGWTWNSDEGAVGKVSTILSGNGRGSLDYGNCGNEGTVRVYLDGKLISFACSNSEKVLEFDYSDGAILEIRNDVKRKSAIKFNSFRVIYCKFQMNSIIINGPTVETDDSSATCSSSPPN